MNPNGLLDESHAPQTKVQLVDDIQIQASNNYSGNSSIYKDKLPETNLKNNDSKQYRVLVLGVLITIGIMAIILAFGTVNDEEGPCPPRKKLL